jgi:hypothetical protein
VVIVIVFHSFASLQLSGLSGLSGLSAFGRVVAERTFGAKIQTLNLLLFISMPLKQPLQELGNLLMRFLLV